MTRTEAGKARIGGLRGWFMREGRQLLVMLVLPAIARTSLANHYSVPSGSMEYTLMPGDHVMVDMSAYGLRVPFTNIIVVPRDEPGRGDIAVFKSPRDGVRLIKRVRSEEHTSELQSLMRISYAVFCLQKTILHTQT